MKEKTCFLIDKSAPTENDISINESNKIRTYKDLEIEIEIENVATKIAAVPAIVKVLSRTKKGIDKYIIR